MSTNRTAIVTGASRGIGREIALRLARDGFDLAIGYGTGRAAAESVASEIRSLGRGAVHSGGDVASEVDVAALFDTAEREFGGVDVVVHAAGTMPQGHLVDLDLDELDTVIRTNLRGTFVVDQQAACRVRTGGAIINLSSSVTRFLRPGLMAYTATKAAVNAMVTVLARELRGRDITVNAVAPGAIETEMFAEYVAEHGEEIRESVAAGSPLERVGTTGDIAALVSFLAGPGRWVNGQVVYANGGAI